MVVITSITDQNGESFDVPLHHLWGMRIVVSSGRDVDIKDDVTPSIDK
jgi:hypothetical protein